MARLRSAPPPEAVVAVESVFGADPREHGPGLVNGTGHYQTRNCLSSAGGSVGGTTRSAAVMVTGPATRCALRLMMRGVPPPRMPCTRPTLIRTSRPCRGRIQVQKLLAPVTALASREPMKLIPERDAVVDHLDARVAGGEPEHDVNEAIILHVDAGAAHCSTPSRWNVRKCRKHQHGRGIILSRRTENDHQGRGRRGGRGAVARRRAGRTQNDKPCEKLTPRR